MIAESAQLVPVVMQVTRHPQLTCRMGPYMTTLSWWLCCPMHPMVKIMGMLGWAEQRSSIHLPPNFCTSLFMSIPGQNCVLWGKPNHFREGSRVKF